MVELRSEGQLVASLGKALLDYLRGICVAAYQTAAQFLYRRRLHEDAQCTFAIELLDIDATLYIYVENYRLALGKLVFYLRLQGAVESILVNFLILQELISLNLGLEFLWRQEEIQEEDSSKNTITVIVNGEPVELSGKDTYIFVDIFTHISFDLQAGKGRAIATVINGRDAQFSEELHEGDQIELYWKEN